jgi:hypothetical protein
MAIIHGYDKPKSDAPLLSERDCITCTKKFLPTHGLQKKCPDCRLPTPSIDIHQKFPITKESMKTQLIKDSIPDLSQDDSELLLESYQLIKKFRISRFEFTYNGVRVLIERVSE